MEQTDSKKFEKEKSTLVDLFYNKQFEKAKIVADGLLQANYLRPLICNDLYISFAILMRNDMEAAKEAANVFKAYDFKYWLPENQRQ